MIVVDGYPAVIDITGESRKKSEGIFDCLADPALRKDRRIRVFHPFLEDQNYRIRLLDAFFLALFRSEFCLVRLRLHLVQFADIDDCLGGVSFVRVQRFDKLAALINSL